MLPIKDLDFDFYSSEYLNFPLIDLDQHYFVPEKVNLLNVNDTYKIIGGVTIKINDATTLANVTESINLTTLPILSIVDLNTGLGYQFIAGQKVRVEHDNSNYFIATVNSYLLGNLNVTVISKSGSSTFSSWTIFRIIDSSVPSFTINSQCSYSVIEGSAFVTYDNPNSLFVPIFDENLELKDFEGFSILKDPTKVVAAQTTDEYLLKTKYLNGLTETEYDFYKENASKDFALRSKILPYITKWAIKNGKDSRDNQYRLNTEIVFGRNNFAPDHTTYTQKTSAFTHEWFYIESQFNYLYDKETVKANSYYFEKPFDLGLATSDPNYFIEYFTYTPIIDAAYSESGKDEEVGPTQLRYASVYKNQAGK
jgi:hypothetical protein